MTTSRPTTEYFSTAIEGLPECEPASVVELADGASFDLHIAPVVKEFGGIRARMLAYNGSIPGPTLRVRQGSKITVRAHNHTDLETTVHWHGVCLDNAYDGVPYATQEPIGIGGEFTYRVKFPHAGVYWYHPHVREDYGLDMGLYGNVIVEPSNDDYWPRADRDIAITVDDILVEGGQIAPYGTAGPNYVAMGRFGNVMLTSGQTDLTIAARVGEIIRFYFTNTANTRIFNIALLGARMKLIGGDSGRYEQESFVKDVLLAPSERAVVDVQLSSTGMYELIHRGPTRAYVLGRVEVGIDSVVASPLREFAALRTAPEMLAEREQMSAHRDRRPDKTLAFKSRMPLLYADAPITATAWTCPMHPDYVSTDPGVCPICGMKLIPADPGVIAADAHEHAPAHDHTHGEADGLEWEDLMPEINRASTPENMIWKLVDLDTGKENAEIDWTFHVGDQVKLRLVNDLDQDHPMHHPFHVHGAGRFLVLSRDNEINANLVWKDTVLIRSGETVDILLDVTNPGRWMAHCHIAEHNQAGMMFTFLVLQRA